MELERSHKRRRYGAELKVKILAECNAPGASVAKVAMSHGINANIVHGWRKLAREGMAAIDVLQREFVPVAVAATPDVRAHDECIEVELCRRRTGRCGRGSGTRLHERRNHSAGTTLAPGRARRGAPTRKRRSLSDSIPPSTMTIAPSQISRTSGLKYSRIV